MTDVNSVGLQQLLEDNPVLAHPASSHTYTKFFQVASDRSMAKDIVWASGLFDEPWLELRELLDVRNGLWHRTDLVCIDHKLGRVVVADNPSRKPEPASNLLEV